MKKPLTFYGHVMHFDTGYILHIPNKSQIAQQAYERFGECRVTVTIQPVKRRRSDAQNAYYWSVVIPALYEGFVNAGNQTTPDDVHTFMKDRFLEAIQLRDRHGNPIGNMRTTTTQLDKEDFGRYLESCIKFAAEYFSITIPDAVPVGSFPEAER